MNKVILKGRTTKDIDFRQTQSGTSAARFTLAVNRKFKNQNGEYEADFINCIAFRWTAEFLNRYVQKGQEILVEGSIRTGSYEKDGVKHFTTDVLVENVEFCGSKSNTSQNVPESPVTTPMENKGNYTTPTPNVANISVQTAQTQFEAFEEILGDDIPPF